jgi:hypothetical protein
VVRIAEEDGEEAQRPLAVVLREPPAHRRRRVPPKDLAVGAHRLGRAPHHVDAREVAEDPLHRGGRVGPVHGLDLLGKLVRGDRGGGRAQRVDEAELDRRPEDQGLVVCQHEFLRLQAELVLFVKSAIRSESASRGRGNVRHGSSTKLPDCSIVPSVCVYIDTERDELSRSAVAHLNNICVYIYERERVRERYI